MINLYKADGNVLVSVDTLAELDPSQNVLWIDLLNPSREEDIAVEEFLKISIPTQEDMKESEPSARLYDEHGADYMTMQAVSLIDLEQPKKCPITFILHTNALVTVRYEDFASLHIYADRAKKKNGVPMASAQGIMFDIIESFINRIADTLETLDEGIDKISDAIFRSKKISIKRKNEIFQASIRKIGGKGDMLGMLRESLTGITRLLSHHNARMPENPPKPVRIKMNSLTRDVAALADHANFLSGKMGFLLDATLGLINLEQNQIIKIFSVAAVVFLPPTLIASMYGMNFQNMPELQSAWGYPITLIVMLVSALIPLAYFQKKGWL
ncbi:MAG: magnesium transporter [Micavibrio aeruginosavorus]|uniref:Magnesium transport protein CorA n=1 Tax=Micavibrio aeruginosavorus TaxID=349221 RepID=A0A2W5PTM2_9BACT|nr:MAG: magnesium transporter [Micavibrio aeruginosavorus]